MVASRGGLHGWETELAIKRKKEQEKILNETTSNHGDVDSNTDGSSTIMSIRDRYVYLLT